jgi:hypothetical protein
LLLGGKPQFLSKDIVASYSAPLEGSATERPSTGMFIIKKPQGLSHYLGI